jgi:hypothetical protein
VLAAALWGAPALASAGGHLVYSAPQGCAAQADFEARVAERGGHFDAYAAPDSGRELRVAITQGNAGYLGTFQALQSEGASAIREVHGATCQDVVAALAVVSAIALRGEDAATSDQETTDARPSVSAPAPSSTPQLAPTVAALPPRPAAPVVDSGRLRASSAGAAARQVAVSAGTVRFDTARSITLSAGGELGILPSKVLPRYDLSISAASFVTMPDGKSYLTGVIPRFRLSYFGNGTHDEQDDRVSARGVGFGLGLCWSPTYDTRGFVALFCAEYGLGVMQFKDVSTSMIDFGGAPTVTLASSHKSSPAFQTAGVSFDGEYRLGSLFHLALKLGIDASLQQLSAQRADGSEIFHSSTLLGYGMLGFGIHF